eukprot:TRINITY_DN90546_c0_g1_i1.p1 TRINITY_DN90546_c0_g1~~TRINITY_DN90546_c0_g1_i1.p1  ORF type:complete len:464 (-),score=46.44 TRINITY_DN90546_c0_g1_i1:88-1404(-)
MAPYWSTAAVALALSLSGSLASKPSPNSILATCSAEDPAACAAQGETLLQRSERRSQKATVTETKVNENQSSKGDLHDNVTNAKENITYLPTSWTQGVAIKSLEQLPEISDANTATITLREVAVGYSGEFTQYVASALEQYHSALHFQIDDGREFVLEMWDNYTGPKPSLVPDSYAEDGTPVWPDHVVVVYTDGYDAQHWEARGQQGTHILLAKDVSGAVLRETMQWVVQWATDPFRRLYIPFTVWRSSSPSMDEKRHGTDTICDTFTEDFYFWFAEHGKDYLNKDVHRIKRNYAPLIASNFDTHAPEMVDATDPAVKTFYKKMEEKGSLKAVMGDLNDWEGPFFVPARVGDPAKYPSKYIKITGFSGTGTFMGSSEYEPMALPEAFYDVCNTAKGKCWFGRWCSRGSRCSNGKCVCEPDMKQKKCAFQGRWRNYCGV